MKCKECGHPDYVHFSSGCNFIYQSIIETLPYVLVGLEKWLGSSITTETIDQCACKIRREEVITNNR